MSCDGGMLHLPSPIIIDILSRLPIKTIIQCKSVCKAWLKQLSDPEFVDLHFSRSPIRLILNRFPASPLDCNCFCLVGLEDEPDHHDLHYLEGTEVEIPKYRPCAGTSMVGSINGLICLNEFEYDIVKIWNPAMGEYIAIEPPQGERVYPNIVSYGFGLSSVKGHYKAVRIFQEMEIVDSNTDRGWRICKSESHVYTVGAGSWRSIGHAPFMYNCCEHAIFLNGNLHWLISDPEGSELISCLDLEKELFQQFPAPPELSQDNLASLNLCRDCLSVCDNTSDFDIKIWVMKEYGIRNSWSKEFVISKYPIDLVGQYYELVHIIKVFKDGEILLLRRADWLICYDPEKKTSMTLDIYDLTGASKEEDINPSIDATDYVASLVSLKNFEMEIVNKI